MELTINFTKNNSIKFMLQIVFLFFSSFCLFAESQDSGNDFLDEKGLESKEALQEIQNRLVFQQAEDFLKSGNRVDALEYYLVRSNLPSKDLKTTFISLCQSGMLLESFGDFDEALKCFFKAQGIFSDQIDPLYYSSIIYRKLGNPFLGYLLIKHALSLPASIAFGKTNLLIELANCAFLSANWKEGLEACNELLSFPDLPKQYLPSIIANKKIAQENIALLEMKSKEMEEHENRQNLDFERGLIN